MKKFLLSSILLCSVIFFQSTLKAQDNTAQISSLLDSIKNCYNGLEGFSFDYGKKEPKLISESDSGTIWSFENSADCKAACLCYSNIGFIGTDKEYLRIFKISSLNLKDFYIMENILYLKTYTDDVNLPITMSHPDAVKLMKIKMWMERLVVNCSSVSPGK